MLTLFSAARVTALGRIALALSLFVLSITDPGNIGFHGEVDDVLAASYLLFALLTGIVAWRFWWLDHVWQGWVLAVDLLIFISLPSLIEPEHDGYRIAALTDGTFIMLSVALRWDWRLAGVVAVVLNLLNWLLTTFHPIAFFYSEAINRGHPPDHDHIRNIYFFLLISLLIVWVGSRMSGPRPAGFMPSGASDEEVVLDEALRFALKGARTESGSICWQQKGSGKCFVHTIDPNGEASGRERGRCAAEVLAREKQACLFDLDWKRCIRLKAGGEIEALGKAWQPPDEILDSGFRKGAFVPIVSASGSGLLMVANSPVPSVDLLRYLVTVGQELAAEFDRNRAGQIAREEELGQLRGALARNLHDSVVQTIAGTRYWLGSVRAIKPSDAQFDDDLARIDAALEVESDRLRSAIEDLRKGPAAALRREFAAGLTRLAEALADQWRVSIDIDAIDAGASVPLDLDFEIQQMIRESVSNAVRHGNATQIVIRVDREGDHLRLTVADNGTGFPDEKQSVKPRMLSQRAKDLGGELTIETSPEGSAIVAMLPLGANT